MGEFYGTGIEIWAGFGLMANFPAFRASKFSKRSLTGKDVLKQEKYILKQKNMS